MQEVLNQMSFLNSMHINEEYLIPGMKNIGTSVKKVEKQNIPSFSGKTQKSLSSKISTNGIGAVTITIGPSSKRRYVFNFIEGGAQWKGSGQVKNQSYLPAPKLVSWIQKKLGAGDEDALRVAFRVAKSIGQRGLPARPIVMPTVEEVRGFVVSSLNEIINRMVEEIHKHDNG